MGHTSRASTGKACLGAFGYPGISPLFTRQDAVEAAWAALGSVLAKHHSVRRYKRGSWGPKGADALIAADGGWYNPVLNVAVSKEADL
jgi:glucose-6-phosphate 1-dehydrogenase